MRAFSLANARGVVRRSQPRLSRTGWHAAARHLRQHAHRRGADRPEPRAAGQHPLPGHGEPLPVRAGVLQSGLGMGRALERHWSGRQGKRSYREKVQGRPAPLWERVPQTAKPGSAERLAGAAVPEPSGRRSYTELSSAASPRSGGRRWIA